VRSGDGIEVFGDAGLLLGRVTLISRISGKNASIAVTKSA
jgi:hypothetical protein